ncbi:hypothetical protein CC1G_10091 [Coprinopsis cinerea okayama7|uniref:Plasma-membrane choline transporter-domain-containing protein n=1 Tax=Coprinopsis cinerea (strain Okayama-7 / 130 / ATCC MYA-4618 / FGSC 9003) TaxID=240176 RepID=A8NDV4_COPC7|nr:hypothetical protein CC1G_10091 [Coprinopsis cinerea okayama7\|eukprot:XP_001832872.2 hypothetical protein CC1G_10091 [Coprinopsis cinerea okayama7\
MAASFAAYASQYLNRQQRPPDASMLSSSSHPMFFSFSTDDGSRGGHGPDSALLDDYDLDDPHLNLRDSGASESTARRPTTVQRDDEDDDDPYLRLDEDERTGRHGFQSREQQQRAPLIVADDDNASLSGSSHMGSPKGWLAHLAASPSLHIAAPTPRPVRSPSPATSSSSDSAPPEDLFGGPSSRKPQHQHRQSHRQHHPIPPPPRTQAHEPQSLSLTESLLPRDGRTRPLDVFSLPDPRHLPRGRRKHNDSVWTSLWLAGVTICVISAIILLFAARTPPGVPKRVLPYVTLLHTVPLLTILTILAAGVAYVHIFLLQIFVKPVMIATSVFVPVTLLISSLWAFIGSFMWEEGTDPTWGETVGLRLFSIIPLILAIYTGRRLLDLPHRLHTTSSTLTLTTHLLMTNPFLLALSPAILLAMLLASLPFLTLIFRLLLIGYSTGGPGKSTGWEWHVHTWANWCIAGAVGIWLWTWGVARGLLRMTTAGVIGAWYFADPSLPPPPPTSTHTIHSALFRSTGPSLGTIVLSALILTSIRFLTLLTIALQRLPVYLPVRIVPIIMPGIRWIVGYIDGVTTALSAYALVYAGLTGDPFMASARRSRVLVNGGQNARGRGMGGRRVAKEVLTFPFALSTYLFVAHTLGAPNEALGAAVLAAGTTGLVGLFCVGLVKDTADTLYLCYCIDKDTGDRRKEEVFIIFEPETANRAANAAGGASGGTQQQTQRGQRSAKPQSSTQHQPQRPSPSHAPQQHQPQHHRISSFTSNLTPPFSSDEESPQDGEVDPFKRSFVDGGEEDDMYADDDPTTSQQRSHAVGGAGGRPAPPIPQHVQQQRPQHQRQGSHGQSQVPVPINAFIQRNRGLSGSVTFSRSPPAAGPAGFPSMSPPTTAAAAQERMMTSTELNMKSHVFQGRAGGGYSVDDSSDEEEGVVGFVQGGSSSNTAPRSTSNVGMSVSGGMEEEDVNPFENAGELESGLSVSSSRTGGEQGKKDKKGGDDMEESDLFPGSGFFN